MKKVRHDSGRVEKLAGGYHILWTAVSLVQSFFAVLCYQLVVPFAGRETLIGAYFYLLSGALLFVVVLGLGASVFHVWAAKQHYKR